MQFDSLSITSNSSFPKWPVEVDIKGDMRSSSKQMPLGTGQLKYTTNLHDDLLLVIYSQKPDYLERYITARGT